jgi:hypothetical protein
VAEFPHTALLYGQRMQWLLVGSDRPLGLEPVRTAARLGPETRDDLRNDAIADLGDFYGGVLQTDAQLRALVAAVEPLSDDRPTIQYPWEPLGHYARYADRLRLRTERVHALGQAEPALTGAVLAHARAVAQVLRALRHSGSSAIEHWEATFGTALQPALAARPGHEGMLELLGIDAERMALAERALARPGARSLLAADRAQLGDRRFWAARTALEEAALDLARSRYYARDYAGALRELGGLRVGANEAARLALLEAGSLRAMSRPAEASAAFERAAASSRHAEFRGLARALARRAAEPFPADQGPLALFESALRVP